MVGRMDIVRSMNIRVREKTSNGEVRNYQGGGISYDQKGLCAAINLGLDSNLPVFSSSTGIEEEVKPLYGEKATDEEKDDEKRTAAREKFKALFRKYLVSGNNKRKLKPSYICSLNGLQPPENAPCLDIRYWNGGCPVVKETRRLIKKQKKKKKRNNEEIPGGLAEQVLVIDVLRKGRKENE